MILRLFVLGVGLALAALAGYLVVTTNAPQPAFTPMEQQWQPPSVITLVPVPPPPPVGGDV